MSGLQYELEVDKGDFDRHDFINNKKKIFTTETVMTKIFSVSTYNRYFFLFIEKVCNRLAALIQNRINIILCFDQLCFFMIRTKTHAQTHAFLCKTLIKKPDLKNTGLNLFMF